MQDKPVRPTKDDPNNESGRISRSGTSAGISVGSNSTSGGEGPIQPDGNPAEQQQGARSPDDRGASSSHDKAARSPGDKGAASRDDKGAPVHR